MPLSSRCLASGAQAQADHRVGRSPGADKSRAMLPSYASARRLFGSQGACPEAGSQGAREGGGKSERKPAFPCSGAFARVAAERNAAPMRPASLLPSRCAVRPRSLGCRRGRSRLLRGLRPSPPPLEEAGTTLHSRTAGCSRCSRRKPSRGLPGSCGRLHAQRGFGAPPST